MCAQTGEPPFHDRAGTPHAFPLRAMDRDLGQGQGGGEYIDNEGDRAHAAPK